MYICFVVGFNYIGNYSGLNVYNNSEASRSNLDTDCTNFAVKFCSIFHFDRNDLFYKM